MKKRFIALFCTLIFTPSPLFAQVYLSEKECIALALEGSVELEQDLELVAIKGIAVRSQKRGAMPSLLAIANGSYSVGNAMGLSEGLRDLGYGAQLKLEQVIYGGNSVNSRVRASRTEQQIAQHTALTTSHNIQHTAHSLYALLMSTFLQYSVQLDYLDVVGKLLDVVQVRFQEGYISKTDVLMVETRQNEARVLALNAKQNYLLAQQQINNLFGNTQNIEYIPIDTLVMPTTMPKEVELNDALDSRPDHLAAINGVEYQENRKKIVRSTYNPKLSASISGHYGTPMPNNLSIKNPLYATATLNFTAQIFNFGKKQLEVKQIEKQKIIAELTVEKSTQTIATQILSAKIKLQNSLQKCQYNAQNLKIANQNLELTTFSYKEGSLPILDVLQAQLQWVTIYNSAITAMYDYALALASYKLAVGQF